MSGNKIVADSPKPPAAGRGRPKGAQNKLTKTVKQAIEAAFDQVGGADYLARMAEQQPAAFLTLIGKVLPMQVEHSNPDGSLKAPTTIQIIAAKAADDHSDD